MFSGVVQRFNWTAHAYCLMGNHCHLVEKVDGNLSQGMRPLNGVYRQRFNRNHERGAMFFWKAIRFWFAASRLSAAPGRSNG
ncbi:MAG: transposase [Gammaproteobacteria bacterium]